MERHTKNLPKKFESSCNLIRTNAFQFEKNQNSNLETEEQTDNIINIIDISGNESPKKKTTIKDFELMYVLGRGSYAKVVKAKNIFTDKFYALKIIDKKFLAKVNIFNN